MILGSGPSGLGAAYRLAQAGRPTSRVLEQSRAVGGNAGSFELAGHHRATTAATGCTRARRPTSWPTSSRCSATTCSTVRGTAASGCWAAGSTSRSSRSTCCSTRHPRFKLGVAADAVAQAARRRAAATARAETFASVLRAGLGRDDLRELLLPVRVEDVGPGARDALARSRRGSASRPDRSAA